MTSTSVPAPAAMSADAVLDAVAARLRAASEGMDVAGNLFLAVGSVRQAFYQVEGCASHEAVDGLLAALAAVLPAAQADLDGAVAAETLDVGLRSLGGIVSCYAPDAPPPDAAARDLVLDWLDAVSILLNELDTARRLRAIRDRHEVRSDAAAHHTVSLH